MQQKPIRVLPLQHSTAYIVDSYKYVNNTQEILSIASPCNKRYAKAPQCYVTRTLPILFILLFIIIQVLALILFGYHHKL